MKSFVTATVFASLAAPILAQTVQPCDWQSRADAIVEPWEDNSRTFANGDVRVTLLDTIEPAAAAFWIMVLSPPYDEVGGRQCLVIGDRGGLGFSGVLFEGLEASYDPARGLTFNTEVYVYDPVHSDVGVATLLFTVNQAQGTVTARLQ